jgi:energy-coupling factor transporter ATP-binding protein EcfA2
MSDLSIKNFKLFKNKTSFKLNPITLLLGANGSGKSSFIQILNLIENNASFFNSSLDEFSFFQHLFNDKDKPLELTYEISKNLFQKNVLSLGFTPDLPGNFWIDTISEKFELKYLNEKDEVVFETHYSREHELYISINIPLFYNILEVNSCKHLADKLRLSDLPQKNIKLSTKMTYRMTDIEFEFGFFNYMFYEFIEKCALNEVSISREEFNSEISRIFNNQYTIDNKGKTIKKSKRLNLKVIKLNNYGSPKKVYSDKDPFGKLISNIHEMQSSNQVFFQKWLKEFFGDDSIFQLKKLHPEFDLFEVKLNDKFLTEHGTGIYRICYLLCDILYLFDDLNLEHIFREENNDEENFSSCFVNRRFLVLEEPEANLHPDFQIKLAEMIFDLNHWLNERFNKHNNENLYTFNVLVETHSEYMIRTFQYLVAKNEGSKNQVGIINFGSGDNIGNVKHISVRPNGSLSDNFYSGFFNYAEDLRLKLDAVNIKRNN